MTHQATGPRPAPPAELAALLAAATEPEREEAWEGFVRAYTAQLLRVARSLGGDPDSVMDRYAFVLDRLSDDECRRLRAYVRPGAGDFVLWLTVVTRRLCLDHYRHRYGRSRADGGAGHAAERAGRRRLVDLVAEKADPMLLAAPRREGPDKVLDRADRERALRMALARLTPSDRLMLQLRFAEEMSAREIAGLMRFPTVFHVYRRLDKVLRELRGTLGELGVEDES